MNYNKENTNLLKGITLLMMMFHHFFGFQFWISSENMWQSIGTLDATIVQRMATYFKFTAGIFAFVTGYALCLKGEKSFKNRINRIVSLLKPYWLVYVMFLLFGIIANEPLPSIVRFLQQCFGVNTATGFDWKYSATIHPIFGWYVSFFIIFILTYPLVVIVCRKNFFIDYFLVILIANIQYYGLVYLMSRVGIDTTCAIGDLSYRYLVYMPIGMCGYLFAKYQVFQSVDKQIKKVNLGIRLVMALVVFIGLERVRVWVNEFRFDYILVPLVIMALIIWLEEIKKFKVLKTFFLTAQKYGTYMWFLHAIYFTPKSTVQWMIYCGKYPVVIYALAIAEMMGLAMLVSKLYDKLCELCDKIRKKRLTQTKQI